MISPVRIGCSGWNYDSWRGRLYPPGLARRRWLERYAERFDTVEVNATFYRLASRNAVAGWVRDTPNGFVFAVKASRYLTHVRRLRDIGEGIRRFYEPLEPLIEAGKLGPVLWQLPENFHRNDAALEGWLEQLPPGRHTLELRHPSWFADDVLSRLSSREVALAVGDHPQRPFQRLEATVDWWFLRFHYGARGRRGNYSERELQAWAQRIAAWSSERDVYAYFNNDWEGFAVANAARLRHLVSGRCPTVARLSESTTAGGRANA